jgi:hypothetical protein
MGNYKRPRAQWSFWLLAIVLGLAAFALAPTAAAGNPQVSLTNSVSLAAVSEHMAPECENPQPGAVCGPDITLSVSLLPDGAYSACLGITTETWIDPNNGLFDQVAYDGCADNVPLKITQNPRTATLAPTTITLCERFKEGNCRTDTIAATWTAIGTERKVSEGYRDFYGRCVSSARSREIPVAVSGSLDGQPLPDLRADFPWSTSVVRSFCTDRVVRSIETEKGIFASGSSDTCNTDSSGVTTCTRGSVDVFEGRRDTSYYFHGRFRDPENPYATFSGTQVCARFQTISYNDAGLVADTWTDGCGSGTNAFSTGHGFTSATLASVLIDDHVSTCTFSPLAADEVDCTGAAPFTVSATWSATAPAEWNNFVDQGGFCTSHSSGLFAPATFEAVIAGQTYSGGGGLSSNHSRRVACWSGGEH